ncbi:MAG: hypothetical protein GY948_23845 [Alphaproteobacteria bacterium]|nr:hypothetical protein [Alphaproteobacteria bacterium]
MAAQGLQALQAALQGLHFLAAQGLQALQAALQGLHFLAAQGLQALQAALQGLHFLAAQGLQALQAALQGLQAPHAPQDFLAAHGLQAMRGTTHSVRAAAEAPPHGLHGLQAPQAPQAALHGLQAPQAALHGLHFLAAHGLQALQAALQGLHFLAAQGLQALQAALQGLHFLAAQGLQALQAALQGLHFLAAHGLQALQAALQGLHFLAAHGLQAPQAALQAALQALQALHGVQATRTRFTPNVLPSSSDELLQGLHFFALQGLQPPHFAAHGLHFFAAQGLQAPHAALQAALQALHGVQAATRMRFCAVGLPGLSARFWATGFSPERLTADGFALLASAGPETDRPRATPRATGTTATVESSSFLLIIRFLPKMINWFRCVSTQYESRSGCGQYVRQTTVIAFQNGTYQSICARAFT